MSFIKATRSGVTPLIGCYGESGSGKTYSALLLARGMAGPNGRVGMIDSESRRGSLYADIIAGGYEVNNIESPFTPDSYVKAMEEAFAQKFDVLVIDSMSHEHEGIGGVLDMAAENEHKSGKAGLHNWKVPKFEHAKMMQFLLRSPIPIITCIRAKYKTRQAKENGRTVIIKDDHVSPIQAEDFIFELTAHFEVRPDHTIVVTKCSHPDLLKCFPEKGFITVEHGAMIAAWCKAPMGAAKGPKTRNQMLGELRDITAHLHGWKKEMGQSAWPPAKAALQKWLVDECGIDVLLDAQSDEQLAQTLVSVQNKLQKPML